MTKMWPLCSKNTTTTSSTTMKMQHEPAATVPPKSSSAAAAITTSKCHCCCLVTKLVRKLKRRSRSTPRPVSASRQGSFQCRYDPLSYSLNFDTTGCGTLLDEDYYKFYAFSSRFVANPRTSCPVLQVAGNSAH
ncbi:uncharacterized protein LOC130713593 [Lotus japonicus]|uniref:Uncharacterized protein n=1 Tax=Lotus japonicus TaxID=34305 RepID=I3SDF1_LOTJA|nr:uncharacterized protein LOC130713593 [Lotus japonicus]AFK38293.1 unknown [Lotus japonicus]